MTSVSAHFDLPFCCTNVCVSHRYVRESIEQGQMGQLSVEDRQKILEGLKKNWDQIHHEYQVRCSTSHMWELKVVVYDFVVFIVVYTRMRRRLHDTVFMAKTDICSPFRPSVYT